MRSELVYSAGLQIRNRFVLATLAIKAVRMLHITNARTEDTANIVFGDVAAGRYTNFRLPDVKPQTAVEPLIVSAA